MSFRKRVSLSTTVSVTTFNAIQQAAIDRDTTSSRAIDEIIREWEESRQVVSINTSSEPSYLDAVAGKLDTIDKLIDEVINKLTRSSL